MNIFIKENEFVNIVWNMAAILSQPQCVKELMNLFDQIIKDKQDIYKKGLTQDHSNSTANALELSQSCTN